MANHERGVAALTEMGFSLLEAEVYVQLVQLPASTGYRLAQELGKAPAGIYKALESLAMKGAVLVDDDGTKSYRAIPAEELLSQVERSFRRRRKAASAALAELEPAPADHAIYRLSSFPQVVERARQMLARARELAVVDLFPASVPLLIADLEAAHARGIHVVAKLYEPCSLDVGYAVVTPDSERLLATWGGDWLNVVIDASEHLLSLLEVPQERVFHATYTNSTYLSILYHSGIVSEIQMDALGTAIAEGAEIEQLRSLRQTHFDLITARIPPGVRELLETLPARHAR